MRSILSMHQWYSSSQPPQWLFDRGGMLTRRGKSICLICPNGRVAGVIWSALLVFCAQVSRLFYFAEIVLYIAHLIVFGSEPPVVSKPAGAPARPVQPPVRSTTSSYPTQPSYPSQPPFPGTSPHGQMHMPSHGGHAPYHAPYPTNTPQGPPSMGYRPPISQPNLPYPTSSKSIQL